MTYKLTTPPEGPTGNDKADIAALYRWAHDLSREREIDKRHIRDAILEAASKASYTITNDNTDREFAADADDPLETADVLATLLRDLAALKILEVN